MSKKNVSVNYAKKPIFYFNLVNSIIAEHPETSAIVLSGLEGAIVTACDAAQLLVVSRKAVVAEVSTDRVLVESRFDTKSVPRSKITITLTPVR